MGRIDGNPTPVINQEEQDVELHDRAHREGEDEEEYDYVPVSYHQHDQEDNFYSNGDQYQQELDKPNSQTLQQQSPISQPFPPQQEGEFHSPQPIPGFHSPQPFPPHEEDEFISPHGPQPFPPQQGGGVHSPGPFPTPPQQGGRIHSPQPFPPQQGGGFHSHSPQPQHFPPKQGGGSHSPQPFPQQGGSFHSPQPFPPQQGGFSYVQSQPQPYNSPHNPHGYGQAQPQPFPPKVAVEYPPSVNYNQYHQTPMVNNVQASSMPVPTTGVPQYQQFNEGWKTGLFDCLEDPENALVTACFPCITFGQIAEIVDNGQTPCSTSGLLYGMIACLIAMPCIISCNYRTRLRTRYGLIESPAPDWLTHCFCECCALCQEYRELQIRGMDPSIGWLGNMAKNQQVQQQQVSTKAPMNQTMMG